MGCVCVCVNPSSIDSSFHHWMQMDVLQQYGEELLLHPPRQAMLIEIDLMETTKIIVSNGNNSIYDFRELTVAF